MEMFSGKITPIRGRRARELIKSDKMRRNALDGAIENNRLKLFQFLFFYRF